MRKTRALAGLFATVLAGLILTTATPASATHPLASGRIGDLDARTFATASTTTRLVTMQPPITSVGYQYWNFSDTTVGTKVTNLATGGCLMPDVSSSTTPMPIIQAPCQGSRIEFWKITSATTSSVMFRSAAYPDRCIGRDVLSPTLPTKLHLVLCQSDDRNQHFRLLT
jgi:hypothetical protein